MRIWGKIWKQNRLLRDEVYEEISDDTRTHKIFRGLEALCTSFDLSVPIWLDATVDEFKRLGKTRFYQDHFIEKIDFDYLEIHIIEE